MLQRASVVPENVRRILRRIRSSWKPPRYQGVSTATMAAFGLWNSRPQALRRILRRCPHRGSPGFVGISKSTPTRKHLCRRRLPGPKRHAIVGSSTELPLSHRSTSARLLTNSSHNITPAALSTKKPASHSCDSTRAAIYCREGEPAIEPATPRKRKHHQGTSGCKRRQRPCPTLSTSTFE